MNCHSRKPFRHITKPWQWHRKESPPRIAKAKREAEATMDVLVERWSKLQNEQMVLSHAQHHGRIQRQEVMELCHLGKDQANRLLKSYGIMVSLKCMAPLEMLITPFQQRIELRYCAVLRGYCAVIKIALEVRGCLQPPAVIRSERYLQHQSGCQIRSPDRQWIAMPALGSQSCF
ncbi:hypothetical protein SAMN06264348_1095 [Oceanospirillum linum]|nr:hypothetical protein SAMN04489856_109124 [Oleiphilus messinensis]SMP31604.1 hypothetical protein SAMN06264348_1095 [Oceanospirillum linum]